MTRGEITSLLDVQGRELCTLLLFLNATPPLIAVPDLWDGHGTGVGRVVEVPVDEVFTAVV